jgi:hypothetical protein
VLLAGLVPLQPVDRRQQSEVTLHHGMISAMRRYARLRDVRLPRTRTRCSSSPIEGDGWPAGQPD